MDPGKCKNSSRENEDLRVMVSYKSDPLYVKMEKASSTPKPVAAGGTVVAPEYGFAGNDS